MICPELSGTCVPHKPESTPFKKHGIIAINVIYRAPYSANKGWLKMLTYMKSHEIIMITRHQIFLTNSFTIILIINAQSLSLTYIGWKKLVYPKKPKVDPENKQGGEEATLCLGMQRKAPEMDIITSHTL